MLTFFNEENVEGQDHATALVLNIPRDDNDNTTPNEDA